MLYWFRTPPFVKVGRAALDPDAKRLLEETYPDISFDWPRILRETPQQMPEDQVLRRQEQRAARDARRRRKRPAEEPTLDAQAFPRAEPAPPAELGPLVSIGPDDPLEAGALEPIEATDLLRTGGESADPVEPLDLSESVEPLQEPGSLEPPPAIPQSPASELLGPETAAHLRNRYVVLMQRIERHPDEVKREELRRDATLLDPGGWATVDEARAAMEGYEALYETLRAQVGGSSRRRRRRRGKGGGQAPPSPDV